MFRKTLMIALLAFASSAALAEEVRIPVGDQPDANAMAKPRAGTSKADVEAKFGSPESRHGPVGDPPISYWEYETFTVYFEYDHVVHTVSKFKSNVPVKQ